ncbi:MAG TPA: hypothetical protein VMB21_01355 [Candidatus Limnocylindria bacterium]|jgi:tetratricopeptide (TPR) repeat protein|nr:hypothetical protein [Candidatus Limnocylindria bacterium]
MNQHSDQPEGQKGAPKDDLESLRLPWPVLVKALLVFATLALPRIFGPPLYRHAKVLRAQAIAREVSGQLDVGPATNRLDEVRSMLELAPNDELVLRAAARFCSSNRYPEAVKYWTMLVQAFPGSPEDQLAFARAAMDQGQYSVSTRELEKMLRGPAGRLAAARLSLELALKRGAWGFACRLADYVLEEAPDDDQVRVWRGQALLRAGLPEQLAEARGGLLAIMFHRGDQWRGAMDVLLEVPELPRSEVALIRHRLHEAGSESVEDRLRVFSADWLWDAGAHEEVTARALSLAGSVSQPREIRLAGGWLLAHGAAERLLTLFPLSRCEGSREKMRLHLLALSQLGRWEEASALIDQGRTSLDAQFGTVLAVAAAVHLRPEQQQDAVRAVLANRQLDLNGLLEEVQLAEANGLDEAAIYLLEPLLENPATMPEAANRILALSGLVDRLSLRRRALDRLVHAFPDDPLALLQLAYVEAVVPGGNLALVDWVGRREGNSTNFLAQVSGAMAEVRRGHAEAALDRLTAFTAPDQAEDYRLHLAYAMAYRVAGDFGAARHHAEQANTRTLKLEERELISDLLPRKGRLN